MKDTEQVYALLVQCNPVPDLEALSVTPHEAELLMAERSQEMQTLTTAGRQDRTETIRPAPRRRFPAIGFAALVLVVGIAGGVLLLTGGDETTEGPRLTNGDFETGDLTGWNTMTSTYGGMWADWVIYEDGQTPPSARQDVTEMGGGFPSFNMPDPPQGRYAAVADGTGPNFTILYQDVAIVEPSVLKATVFYRSTIPIAAPDHFRVGSSPSAPRNQQLRIDLIDPDAQVYTIDDAEVLATVFRLADGDPGRLDPTEVTFDLTPWEGQTVRLRVVQVANWKQMLSGIDNVRIEPIG